MTPVSVPPQNPAVVLAFFGAVAAVWRWVVTGNAPRPRHRASDRGPRVPPVDDVPAVVQKVKEPAIPKAKPNLWAGRYDRLRYMRKIDLPKEGLPDPIPYYKRRVPKKSWQASLKVRWRRRQR